MLFKTSDNVEINYQLTGKGKIIVLYEESGLFYDGVKMQSIGKSFFIVDNK